MHTYIFEGEKWLAHVNKPITCFSVIYKSYIEDHIEINCTCIAVDNHCND